MRTSALLFCTCHICTHTRLDTQMGNRQVIVCKCVLHVSILGQLTHLQHNQTTGS